MRTVTSTPRLGAIAQPKEATPNSSSPAWKARRAPIRSLMVPESSSTEASTTVYPSTTHCSPVTEVCRPSAMRSSAMVTTVVSRMTTKNPVHTTTSGSQEVGRTTRFSVDVPGAMPVSAISQACCADASVWAEGTWLRGCGEQLLAADAQCCVQPGPSGLGYGHAPVALRPFAPALLGEVPQHDGPERPGEVVASFGPVEAGPRLGTAAGRGRQREEADVGKDPGISVDRPVAVGDCDAALVA